jgi:hypothetical protein
MITVLEGLFSINFTGVKIGFGSNCLHDTNRKPMKNQQQAIVIV